MKAISGPTAERDALLAEYRAALRLWSDTKSLYGTNSEEFAHATSILAELEFNLIRSQQSLAKRLPYPATGS